MRQMQLLLTVIQQLLKGSMGISSPLTYASSTSIGSRLEVSLSIIKKPMQQELDSLGRHGRETHCCFSQGMKLNTRLRRIGNVLSTYPILADSGQDTRTVTDFALRDKKVKPSLLHCKLSCNFASMILISGE